MPFDITKLDAQVVIFGGLTLIGLGLIWLVFKLSKYYYNHTNEVIKENSNVIIQNSASHQRVADSQLRLAESHDKLAQAINQWHVVDKNKRKKK